MGQNVSFKENNGRRASGRTREDLLFVALVWKIVLLPVLRGWNVTRLPVQTGPKVRISDLNTSSVCLKKKRQKTWWSSKKQIRISGYDRSTVQSCCEANRKQNSSCSEQSLEGSCSLYANESEVAPDSQAASSGGQEKCRTEKNRSFTSKRSLQKPLFLCHRNRNLFKTKSFSLITLDMTDVMTCSSTVTYLEF